MIAPYLLQWAAQPGPRKLLAEARRRIEAGRLGQRATVVVELSDGERREVGQIADATWAASGRPVRADQLRAWLAANGVDLEALLVAIEGPLRDLRAERAAARQRVETDREAGRELLRARSAELSDEVLASILAKSESWEHRAGEILTVVDGLADRPEQLPVLAARLFADAHALDRSRPLGRAVARFLAALRATPEQPYADPVVDVAAWHEAWASREVICDAVSAQVLVLNLPLTGPSPAARLAAVSGEPVWLTLRSMTGGVGLDPAVSEVFVCENPAIIEAAADAYGDGAKPMVCTYGFPNLATTTLLRALARTAKLRVRADGDAAGWFIVRQLLALPGATPWRMKPDETRFEEELLDDLLTDIAPGPTAG